MSSNINPYNINGAFPIAGQDNSSQGFRTNFTNTQNNFAFAQAEISDLQAKAIVTSTLTGQTFNNDMAGTKIIRPQLSAWTQSLVDLGAVSSSAILDYNVANFQKITSAGTFDISFANWPATVGSGALGYGVMRVWVVITDVAHTMTLPDSVNIEVGDIAGYDIATKTITFDAAGNYIFDFSSIDGGNDYMIFDVTRNRASFRDHQLYYNPDVSPTMYVGFGEGLSTAQAIGGGLDAIAADGSVSSVGITTTANLAYTVPTGGYSVVAMRGNIEADTVSPVASNDYLGYFDAYAFTGNGTSNTFAKTASISMFVTGSNVVTGLGGNVAIFTKPAGTGNISTGSTQVVGFENDQSTKFYGNVEVSSNFKTDSTIIEGGTYRSVLTAGGTFTANAGVSTVIVDSSSSATIATATIITPRYPRDRQKFTISSVCPITSANIWANDSVNIHYVASNKFSSGNVVVKLTYLDSTSTWYLS